jgi:hypothetical protein
MSEDNSYEILIRLDQRVEDLHTSLIGPNGRIPKVEETVEEHSAQIHQWTGSLKLGTWVVGAILTLFGGVLVSHIFHESNQHNVIYAPTPAQGTADSHHRSNTITLEPSHPQP